MGLWARIIVVRAESAEDVDADLVESVIVDDLPLREGWRRIVLTGTSHQALVDEVRVLAENSGTHVLGARVLGSACAVLAGADPDGSWWQTSLHERVFAAHGAPLVGEPVLEAAPKVVAWAERAGLRSDPRLIGRALAACEDSAERTFDGLIVALDLA
ncbi:hypothetical protein [Longispora albida]|uniref:hypothetical protein n=1 Tax=Longispora albida TaxID=203523 RepID=UPI00036E41CB|nr:hypothetical protein [Longispora albida]